MTLRPGQLERQIAGTRRKLADRCDIYQVEGVDDEIETLIYENVPCRFKASGTETDITDSGDEVYIQRWEVTLPGDLTFPTAKVRFKRMSDSKALDTLTNIPTPDTEQTVVTIVCVENYFA